MDHKISSAQDHDDSQYKLDHDFFLLFSPSFGCQGFRNYVGLRIQSHLGQRHGQGKEEGKPTKDTALAHCFFTVFITFRFLFYTDTFFLPGVVERRDANIDTPFFLSSSIFY